VLLAWVVVIAGFTALLQFALNMAAASIRPTGIPLFGGLMLFVLGLALLVAPALTAQSINGDRERGTLATVQITRLSAVDIALGKLAAAWGTALVFLVLTLPFVLWSILEGGVGIGRAAVVLGVVAVLLGVICAVAQGCSAVLARGIGSALLSYVLMFALSVGTVIAFGLTTIAFTESPEPLPAGQPNSVATTDEPHPEDVWWLLAPNPFVVLADSAPAPPPVPHAGPSGVQPMEQLDPLGSIGQVTRMIRTPTAQRDQRTAPDLPNDALAVWPYGLGFDVLLAIGAVWISVRRLGTPSRKVTPGVRIA
jgi:ABC-type transport system involved in multi-copper enzyme maturation permease subunit